MELEQKIFEIVFEKISLLRVLEHHCSCNGGDDNPWPN